MQNAGFQMVKTDSKSLKYNSNRFQKGMFYSRTGPVQNFKHKKEIHKADFKKKLITCTYCKACMNTNITHLH